MLLKRLISIKCSFKISLSIKFLIRLELTSNFFFKSSTEINSVKFNFNRLTNKDNCLGDRLSFSLILETEKVSLFSILISTNLFNFGLYFEYNFSSICIMCFSFKDCMILNTFFLFKISDIS